MEYIIGIDKYKYKDVCVDLTQKSNVGFLYLGRSTELPISPFDIFLEE
jgi:hypothetical protein